MDLFLISLSCSIDLFFVCQYHTTLIIIALQLSLNSGSVISPALFFFLKTVLTFVFCTDFLFICTCSVKKCHWKFVRDFIESVDCLG